MREASYYTKITESRLGTIRSNTMEQIENSIFRAASSGYFCAHVDMTDYYNDTDYYKELLLSRGYVVSFVADRYMKISWYP